MNVCHPYFIPGWLVAVAAGWLCLAPAVSARAQAPTNAGPEITSRVIPVVVTGAVCAAVHDASGTLVIGRRISQAAQLLVFPLETGGQLKAVPPAPITLPCPPALTNYPSYPLGLAFHPRLPLLYVWQDIAGPPAGTPTNNPIYREFDHLLIYALKDGALQPLQTAARGADFAYGLAVGLIALDPAGRRIFLPNLQMPAAGRVAIGYLPLDTNGLPATIEGATNSLAVIDVTDIRACPTGLGFVPVSDKVLIFSGNSGASFWDTLNRRAALGYVPVRRIPRNCFIGGHPKLPVVFGAGCMSDTAFRIEHAEGYLTLLPQTVAVSGADFRSAPVVMTGNPRAEPRGMPDRLAIGGVNRLYFLPLDAEGRFSGLPEAMPVASPAVLAIAYSTRFDRLYVAVEKLP